MNVQPSVSVLIPTYGHRDCVAQTLATVLAQDYLDREVIVLNDGSPDDTRNVLRPFIDAGQIRYLEQPNRGVSAARNRLLSEAKGRYLAFIDDDDLWPEGKLAWQVAAMDADPTASFVYGFAEVFGTESRPPMPGPDAPRGWCRQAFVDGCCIYSLGQTLLRRSMVENAHGFDERLWGTDDWDIYIRLAAAGPVIYHHRCALQYRLHTRNASNDLYRMYSNCCRLRRKHLNRPPSWTDVKRWLAAKKRQAVPTFQNLLVEARRCLKSGNKREARRLALQAVRVRPMSLRRWNVLRDVLSLIV
ncbi:MAG TPA: glycosyltransferase family A protein [Phycisphaerae bacterium]|nr:glycosyltransferase family A protein [Phycisphaerae bacterium]